MVCPYLKMRYCGLAQCLKGNGETSPRNLKQDKFNNTYQDSVNESDEIQIVKLKERDGYIRNRNIALERLELSEFSCEYDSAHKLFVSRFSRKPYLEAHHLIPNQSSRRLLVRTRIPFIMCFVFVLIVIVQFIMPKNL